MKLYVENDRDEELGDPDIPLHKCENHHYICRMLNNISIDEFM